MNIDLFGAIALSSMIPITELRATIPIFITRHPEVPIWFIFTAAVVGNMIPNFFLLWFLPRFNSWLHDHVAGKINRIVIPTHDFFIKNNRLHYFYTGIALVTLAVLSIMYGYHIKSPIWYGVVIIAGPLWGYITYTIFNKAYDAAMNEKSIIHWFYNKVHKQHSEKFYKWGSLALVAIVGIPIPGTGSWTGSLLAFLFGIPYWRAIGLIFTGILIAGGIVTGLSTGIISSLGL